jgi:PAS domain S-box-containing protein
LRLRADARPLRVPQVTNALKFSNNSPVCVRVALEPKAQDEEEEPPTMRTLRVDVADQGVGVAPEDQERVFKKYERAAPEAGGGAGLGLHLCRSFARAMDGDVSLASELSRGATFTLRVPVRVLAHDEAPPPSGDVAAAACKPAAQAPDLFGRVLANQAAGRLPAVDPFAEVLLEEMVQHYLREAREVFAFSAPLSGEQDSTTPVVAYVSPSVRTVLGWEPEQLMGSTGVPLLHPDDVDKHAGSAAALWAAEGRFVYGMRRVRRANGSYLWMHMEMYRAPDAGNVHYILWRDATSFKESQSSLKEYLLATSHDMRTPVTGIVTAAQLLEARPCVRADAEAAFLVQSIKSCGGLMDSVISNVMQLRSLDDLDDVEAVCAARDVLQPVPFDPRVLVDDVLLATCTALGHDCRHLGISQPAALPACVVADRERLQRTVQNLLICLLRHSTDDRQLSIRLACERSSGAAGLDAAVASAADETAELQLDLSDAARDVAPEAFELMFAPYFSSKTPDAGGLHSGLGLCVARAFARAMGGSLAAERVAPPGVTPSGIAIRLRLPVHVPAGGAETARQLKRAAPGASTPKARYSNTLTALPAASEAPGAPGQKRILLVEDHELILKLLRSAGFEVSTAVNGAEALQQLQAAATLPDAVLTDISMPVMDGLQFARAFRAWEATQLPLGAPRLPIIALSANVLEEHVQQSYDAGMTCHFAKPLRPDAVQELRRILHCADDDAPTSLPQ